MTVGRGRADLAGCLMPLLPTPQFVLLEVPTAGEAPSRGTYGFVLPLTGAAPRSLPAEISPPCFATAFLSN
ncbi:MAG: hypothetical protein ACTSRL_05235 [Candidatus Helarchaeota archaeon]